LRRRTRGTTTVERDIRHGQNAGWQAGAGGQAARRGRRGTRRCNLNGHAISLLSCMLWRPSARDRIRVQKDDEEKRARK
jgi:hypothetical protein